MAAKPAGRSTGQLHSCVRRARMRSARKAPCVHACMRGRVPACLRAPGWPRCAAVQITVNAICPGYTLTDLIKNQINDTAKIRCGGLPQHMPHTAWAPVLVRHCILLGPLAQPEGLRWFRPALVVGCTMHPPLEPFPRPTASSRAAWCIPACPPHGYVMSLHGHVRAGISPWRR